MNRSSIPPQALFLLVVVMLIFSALLFSNRPQPRPPQIRVENVCQLYQSYDSEIVNQVGTEVTDHNTVVTMSGVFPYDEQPDHYDYSGYLYENYLPYFLTYSPPNTKTTYVAMIGENGGIDIVDTTTMQIVSSLPIELRREPTSDFSPGTIAGTFSPDATLFAASSSDETWIWEVQSGKQLHRIPHGTTRAIGDVLNFSPDNRWLTINQWTVDGIHSDYPVETTRSWLFLIDLQTGDEHMLYDAVDSVITTPLGAGFSQDSQMLYTTLTFNQIETGESVTDVQQWDLETVTSTNTMRVVNSSTWSVETDPTDRYLVGWDAGSLWIADLETWSGGNFPQMMYQVPDESDAYQTATINPTGDLLVVGSQNGVLEFIELETGNVLRQMNTGIPYIQHMEFNAQGDTLIVMDQVLRLYQLNPENSCA